MKTDRLTTIIQWGLLLILAVMPVHAFLSVWLGNTFGHEAVFQAWKEVVLVVLSLLTVMLLIQDRPRFNRLCAPWVIGSGALLLVGLLVTAVNRPDPVAAAFGAKTDFEFLLAAVIAAVVVDGLFLRRAVKILLIMMSVVTAFDVLQILVLPPDFLIYFGYGRDTINPFQTIAEGARTLRFPSTLGGPNQLGTYLILPLTVLTGLILKTPRPNRRWMWQIPLLAAGLISLTWTFSRSAWLGAAVALIITVLAALPGRWRRPVAVTAGLAGIALLLLLPAALGRGGQLQYFLLHASVAQHDNAKLSDSQHARSLSDGVKEDLQDPLGHGLGTAGPATFHAGSTNIIENYYLQVGYETGLVGLLLFGFIVVTLLLRLLRRARRTDLAMPTAAAIIGVSLVALVLPSWVDSTTALVTWIFAGAVAGLPMEPKHV